MWQPYDLSVTPPHPPEIDWLDEALAGRVAITAKRMFGGLGVYGDGLFFAMVAEDALWLKADEITDAAWDAAGAARFAYDFGAGKMSGSMNYRRLPDAAMDDAEELRRWAELALAAAARAASRKRR